MKCVDPSGSSRRSWKLLFSKKTSEQKHPSVPGRLWSVWTIYTLVWLFSPPSSLCVVVLCLKLSELNRNSGCLLFYSKIPEGSYLTFWWLKVRYEPLFSYSGLFTDPCRTSESLQQKQEGLNSTFTVFVHFKDRKSSSHWYVDRFSTVEHHIFVSNESAS